MKNKKLIVMVSIVILLTILNVAFYGYMRINNQKEINKEHTDYQEAEETSLTEGQLANLNKTTAMYSEYYNSRVEYEKEAEIKREQEEKKKQEEVERKKKVEEDLKRKQEEEKKKLEQEAKIKAEEQGKIRLEQEKKRKEDEMISNLNNITELKDLVKAIHNRLNEDVCYNRTPSEDEYKLLSKCAAVFENKAKTINNNEDLKLDINDLVKYLKDGGNNKDRDKIVLAHRMSHDLDYHYFQFGSNADLFCIPRSIKVRPER